jgi:hypothetical protein
MMKRRQRAVTCALVCASALGAAGCSSDGLGNTGAAGTEAQQGTSFPGFQGQKGDTSVSCAAAGGDCLAPQDCKLGAGVLASDKYACGGSSRACCLPNCGGHSEDVQCCNAAQRFALRPLCQDGQYLCDPGYSRVPLGSCR